MAAISNDQKLFALINERYEACNHLVVTLFQVSEASSKKAGQIYQKYRVEYTELKVLLRLAQANSPAVKQIYQHQLDSLKEFSKNFKGSVAYLAACDLDQPLDVQVAQAKKSYLKFFSCREKLKTEKKDFNSAFRSYISAYVQLKKDLKPVLLTADTQSKEHVTFQQITTNVKTQHAKGCSDSLVLDRLSWDAMRIGSIPDLSECLEPVLREEGLETAPEISSAMELLKSPPVGLRNPYWDNCWLNSALQVLLYGSPQLVDRAAQSIPLLQKMVALYRAAQVGEDSKIRRNISEEIRAELVELSGEDIEERGQDDAVNFFHEVFSGGNVLYRFNRTINGEVTENVEPKAVIDLEMTDQKERPLKWNGSLYRFFHRNLLKFKDEKTGKVGNAQMHLAFREPPQTLVFQVKRFTHHDYGFGIFSTPNHDDFYMPSHLELPADALSQQTTKEERAYECTAFNVHTGALEGGHYVAYVKHKDQWYCCNDSIVSEVSEEEMRAAKRQGYLYTYRHKTVS